MTGVGSTEPPNGGGAGFAGAEADSGGVGSTEPPNSGGAGFAGAEADSRELVERAIEVSQRAYAPYSDYFVGAVVRTRDGHVFEGVNVENAAYPLGVCAEKSALVAAVSAGYGPGDFVAIGISASPCGGCRQWLYEMRIDQVSYRRASGEIVTSTPGQLLPDTWDL